mgnify:CR=1 FL=1
MAFRFFPAAQPGSGTEPRRHFFGLFSGPRAGAFEGPVAGYFMDRYGPRPLILIAIIMSSAGHMLLSEVQSYFALLVIYLGVVSLSFQAGFMDAPMVIANTWFIRMRTRAMSLISASVNLGGFLLTPLLAWAIHTWGWRPAAFGSGIIFLLAGLPLALLVRRSPESMGLQPDGDSTFHSTQTQQRGQTQRTPQEAHFTLAESMRTSPFGISPSEPRCESLSLPRWLCTTFRSWCGRG